MFSFDNNRSMDRPAHHQAESARAESTPSKSVRTLAEIMSAKNRPTSDREEVPSYPRLGAEPVRWGSSGGPGRPQTPSNSSSTIAATNTTERNNSKGREVMTNSLDSLIAHASSTLREHHDGNIVDTVLRDIVQRDLGVTFNDIAALGTAKRLLNEAVVLPLMIPEFFTGIREPWKVSSE